ncbi:MAG: fasciclin domain-containing protein [Bacteroidales bacterium]|nr:fasciclin domain-containing protein [Bacteroidales bacterium]
MEEYYEVPAWLKGNAWELLEAKGDCSIFLEAIEEVGYREVIQGRGIITVLAPDDAAFAAYLSSRGLSSPLELPLEELKELIGFHLVYYSFDQQRFANYRPDGITGEEPISDAGLYYKFRTKSNPGTEVRIDYTVPVNEIPPALTIFHKERFLPVLSGNLFNSKGIDASSNYDYFFPGKSFPDGQDDFNIMNAAVKDYALVADNGYVYIIDAVLDLAESIYETIGQKEQYSQFLGLYDIITVSVKFLL